MKNNSRTVSVRFVGPGEPSTKVTPAVQAEILYMLREGFKQHQIAARLHLDQSRVSEVKRKFLDGGAPPPEPKAPDEPHPLLPF